MHPLCIYGCLQCLARFGPHITKTILLPKIPIIAKLLRSQLNSENSGAQELEIKAKQLQTWELQSREILMVNLQTLEQVCHSLASYLAQNELSNTADLASVQQTIAEVFPASLQQEVSHQMEEREREPE